MFHIADKVIAPRETVSENATVDNLFDVDEASPNPNARDNLGSGMRSDGRGPGWYVTPDNAELERYWDGTAWTDQQRATLLSKSDEPVSAAGPDASDEPAIVAEQSEVPAEALDRPVDEQVDVVLPTVSAEAAWESPRRVVELASTASASSHTSPSDGAENTCGTVCCGPCLHSAADSGRPSRSRFLYFWVLVPFLFVVVPFGWVGIAIWPQGFTASDRSPGKEKGGILIFMEENKGPSTSVDVAASAWDLYPGGAMVRLKLNFAQYAVGKRFFVIPSGQYQVDEAANLAMFCGGGAGVAVRAPDVVRCVQEDLPGPTGLEYRLGAQDQLGTYVNDEVYSVVDLNGYSGESASIITGIVPAPELSHEEPVTIFIPVHDFPVRQLGAVEYRSFAGIGQGDSEYGSLKLLRQIPDSAQLRLSAFADARTGKPISKADIAQASFYLQEDLGTRQLQWSVPEPVEPNTLRWEEKGSGLSGIQFQILDPFRQDSLTRRGFLSGVAMTFSIGGLFLIFERSLERIVGRRTPAGAPSE